MTIFNNFPGGKVGVKGLNLLSHRQKTKQSSTGWGGKSSRAVDGNVSGWYGHRLVEKKRNKYNCQALLIVKVLNQA